MLKMQIGGKKSSLTSASVLFPLYGARRSWLRLLDKENLRLDMTKLGFAPESLVSSRSDFEALRHGAGDWTDRFRQDQHALLVDFTAQPGRYQHYDREDPANFS